MAYLSHLLALNNQVRIPYAPLQKKVPNPAVFVRKGSDFCILFLSAKAAEPEFFSIIHGLRLFCCFGPSRRNVLVRPGQSSAPGGSGASFPGGGQAALRIPVPHPGMWHRSRRCTRDRRCPVRNRRRTKVWQSCLPDRCPASGACCGYWRCPCR